MGNKGRLSTRIGTKDVDRVEIYMHQFQKMLSKFNEDSYRVYINRVSKSYPYTMEKKRDMMYEIARLEMFVEMFDSISGGRGTVYLFEDVVKRVVTRFGNINVAHGVTNIPKMTIIHGAQKKDRIIASKYKVESFTYEELTNGNLINIERI